MKKYFIFILLFYCVTSFATKKYIATTSASPAGNNGNSGTIASPWLTLQYACTQVHSPDTIFVTAGTYIENTVCTKNLGVSIVGAGVTSIITTTNTSSYAILSCFSGSEGVSDNCSISYLLFDGQSRAAASAIRITALSNIKIHHCTFNNFYLYAIRWTGKVSGAGAPTIFGTGNTFHDCYINNCGGWQAPSDGSGDFNYGGQDGMTIYNDTIVNTTYISSCLKFDGIGFGYNKNTNIYNSKFWNPIYTGTDWPITLELWNDLGGNKIHDCQISSGIDLNGCRATGAAYSYDIYNNVIGRSVITNYAGEYGITHEHGTGVRVMDGVIIRQNLFQNLDYGIYYYLKTGKRITNCTAYSNLIINCGINNVGGSQGYGIYFAFQSTSDTMNNIKIINNTITAKTSGLGNTQYGIGIPDNAKARNIAIKNNIISGFFVAPIYGSGSGTLDTLSIQNNDFYNCGNANSPKYVTIVPTNNTTSNNLIQIPKFANTSRFDLQITSALIYKGISTSYTTDYASHLFNRNPTIGAYEMYSNSNFYKQAYSVINNTSKTTVQ